MAVDRGVRFIRRDAVLAMALFVTATFVVTPYAFNYDLVVFGWVLGLLLARGGNAPCDYALMLALWMLPAATMILRLASIPGSALVLPAFSARFRWRLRAAEAPRGRRLSRKAGAWPGLNLASVGCPVGAPESSMSRLRVQEALLYEPRRRRSCG